LELHRLLPTYIEKLFQKEARIPNSIGKNAQEQKMGRHEEVQMVGTDVNEI
jgi:hypothetical protein